MPYLLSRASLSSLPQPATELYSDIESRVAGWSNAKVWYDTNRGEEKPAQSWGTESVMNALALTLRDVRADDGLSREAETALDHMWERQSDDGSWPWLHFGLGPWESDGSEYWGSSLAAVASATAAHYETPPAGRSAKLRDYLRSGLSTPLSAHNQLALLWAASAWDDLLSDAERRELIDAVLELQQPDGGFRLHDMAPWPSEDGTLPSQVSDGYATAFTTFVLQQVDTARADDAIGRALAWLEGNQLDDGRWETLSLNMDRSQHEPFRRLLMSDAATAFAVLALTAESEPERRTEP